MICLYIFPIDRFSIPSAFCIILSAFSVFFDHVARNRFSRASWIYLDQVFCLYQLLIGFSVGLYIWLIPSHYIFSWLGTPHFSVLPRYDTLSPSQDTRRFVRVLAVLGTSYYLNLISILVISFLLMILLLGFWVLSGFVVCGFTNQIQVRLYTIACFPFFCVWISSCLCYCSLESCIRDTLHDHFSYQDSFIYTVQYWSLYHSLRCLSIFQTLFYTFSILFYMSFRIFYPIYLSP